jgi:hypothetical protein
VTAPAVDIGREHQGLGGGPYGFVVVAAATTTIVRRRAPSLPPSCAKRPLESWNVEVAPCCQVRTEPEGSEGSNMDGRAWDSAGPESPKAHMTRCAPAEEHASHHHCFRLGACPDGLPSERGSVESGASTNTLLSTRSKLMVHRSRNGSSTGSTIEGTRIQQRILHVSIVLRDDREEPDLSRT